MFCMGIITDSNLVSFFFFGSTAKTYNLFVCFWLLLVDL